MTSRAKIKAAFTRYCNHEGPFAKLDDEGDKREVWTDEFMTAVAPWTWWQDVAQVAEPELHALAWRTLQVGVASSCNERVFSARKNIMGDKRTRIGSKRQRGEVSIYTNSRVLKKFESDIVNIAFIDNVTTPDTLCIMVNVRYGRLMVPIL